MDNREILDFVKRHPVFYLATCVNNIPHVRVMTVCKADDDGILFNTKSFKSSSSELQDNPEIEMCFYSPQEGIQIRLAGKVEIVDDHAVKQDIVREFPILESLVKEKGYDAIVPYRLRYWKAKFWVRSKKHCSEDII